MSHPFMEAVADGLADRDIATLRYQFPYMEEGGKRPDSPKVAQASVRAAVGEALRLLPGIAVVAGGKSFGGRMASLAVAEGMDARSLVFLGYPLHAPKKEDKLRDEHLYALAVPMLFLEGTRDPFANRDIMTRVFSNLNRDSELLWLEGGDHSFKVARSGRTVSEDGAGLAEATAEFIRTQLAKD